MQQVRHEARLCVLDVGHTPVVVDRGERMPLTCMVPRIHTLIPKQRTIDAAG